MYLAPVESYLSGMGGIAAVTGKAVASRMTGQTPASVLSSDWFNRLTPEVKVAAVKNLPAPVQTAILSNPTTAAIVNAPAGAPATGLVIPPLPVFTAPVGMSLGTKLAIGAGIAAAVFLGWKMLGRSGGGAPAVTTNPRRRRARTRRRRR